MTNRPLWRRADFLARAWLIFSALGSLRTVTGPQDESLPMREHLGR